MAKAALTKRTIDAASPAAREYIVWDDGGKETVKGFGLRVSPSGGKTYIFQYRLAVPGQAAATTPRKYTIGKHGQLTPDQARTRAKELAFQVAQGIDPRETELERFAARERARADAERDLQEREAQSFRSLSAKWLEEYVLDHRSATVGQARVAMSKYLTPVLGDTVVRDIVKADVQRVIDRIPARRKATRQQVYAYASVFFKWALERDYTADNPLAGLSKPKGSKARDRVLSDVELALVLRASERVRTPFGPFFRLLIYTGQRREEVASIQWSDLDRQAGTWLIQADDAKNHRAHVVPLNALALHELDVLAGLAGTFKGEPARQGKAAIAGGTFHNDVAPFGTRPHHRWIPFDPRVLEGQDHARCPRGRAGRRGLAHGALAGPRSAPHPGHGSPTSGGAVRGDRGRAEPRQRCPIGCRRDLPAL